METTRIPAAVIFITRAEGPTRLCGVRKEFTGPSAWHDASTWLRSQALTFSATSYDKHDFDVYFADGEKYTGRLDCKPSSDLDIAKHVCSFLAHYAQREPSKKTEVAAWLAKYQIG